MYVMRPLRNFKTNQCCYLISRIANRAFFLNDEEKTRFVERLWRVATFSCVEVLAYCCMSNHFHILVYVPDPRELSDDELLARIRVLYSGTALAKIEKEWKARRRNFARFEQSLPDRVPHLLENGNDKVAYDILKQLADGSRRPAELRAGIARRAEQAVRGATRMREHLQAREERGSGAEGQRSEICAELLLGITGNGAT